MFSYTDRAVDEAVLTGTGRDELAGFGRDAIRLSRQAEARAVLAAYQIGLSTYNDRLTGRNGYDSTRVRTLAEKAALGEISLQLGISRTKAGHWSNLGELLQHHPKIREAYLDGEMSTHRMGVAVRAAAVGPDGDLRERLAELADTANTDDPDVAASDNDAPADGHTEGDADDPVAEEPVTEEPVAEEPVAEEPWDFDDVVLDLIRRPTTDTVLHDDLDATIISLEPDRAVEAREDIAELFGDVTIGNESFGHMTVDACVPAEHGVHLRDRMSALLARRVCRRDPRSIKAQRVAAFAEIIGAPSATLRCQCGDDSCPTRQTRATTDTSTSTGTSTGTGIADRPATHQPAVPTAEPADDDSPEAPGDKTSGTQAPGTNTPGTDTPGPDNIHAPSTDHHSTPAADRDEHPDSHPVEQTPDEQIADAQTPLEEPVVSAEFTGSTDDADSDVVMGGLTLLHDPTGRQPTRLQGYGAIDPAHAARLAPVAGVITTRPGQTRPASGLIIPGNRAPAPPIDPTGHGGYATPPPGALTYAPSAALRAEIIQLDRRCRYPYCSRPSEECELDHLAKFRHADPVAGGWTVAFNLAPLCRPDHDRKHDGPWLPTMHTDRTITWHNTRTGQRITTYPR